MRTTLTLDPDVASMLESEVHRRRQPFKQVVNDAIRRGLGPRMADEAPEPYRVVPHRANLLPGLDAGKLNQLADELEDAAVTAKRKRR